MLTVGTEQRFHHSAGKLEFMMTILSRDKCHILGPFIADSNCISSWINLNTKNPKKKKRRKTNPKCTKYNFPIDFIAYKNLFEFYSPELYYAKRQKE